MPSRRWILIRVPLVALRFGDHGTKEMLGLIGFKICATTPKTQQHAKQGVQTESTSDMQQCRVRLQGALSSTRNEKLPDRRLKLAPGLPGDISWEKP